MAQLTIRNVDDEVVRALKVRAAKHGRSEEAELREIVRQALRPPSRRVPLLDFLAGMPETLDEDAPRRGEDPPCEFDL